MSKRPAPASSTNDDCFTADALFEAYNDPAQLQPEDIDVFKQPLWTLGDEHLFRAPSVLNPAAGMGLFTRTDIRCGAPITWYSGAVVPFKTATDMKKLDASVKDYMWALMRMRFIALGDYVYDHSTAQLKRVPHARLDVIFHGDGAAQFANSISPPSVGADKQNVAYINVADRRWHVDERMYPDILARVDALQKQYAHAEGRACILFALRPIAAGEELIADYGEGYFAAAPVRFRCAACDAPEPLNMCGACKQVSYCNVTCQRMDARRHVLNCVYVHE